MAEHSPNATDTDEYTQDTHLRGSGCRRRKATALGHLLHRTVDRLKGLFSCRWGVRRSPCARWIELQARVYRLTLQSKDAEDALVDAT